MFVIGLCFFNEICFCLLRCVVRVCCSFFFFLCCVSFFFFSLQNMFVLDVSQFAFLDFHGFCDHNIGIMFVFV